MRARTKRRAIRWAADRLERRDLLAVVLPVVGQPISAHAGSPFSGAVGDFVDLNLADTATDFQSPTGSISIDWGDQGTSSGTVVLVKQSLLGNVFEVDGAHTYADQGHFTTSIKVQNGAGDRWSGSGAATVSATTPATLTIAANSFKAVAGTSTTPTVATFIDPDTPDVASDYAALISWGDGHSSAGTVSGSKGVFTVTGTNTYAAPGVYSFTLTIVGHGMTPGTTGTATIVANPPFSFTALPVVIPSGVPLTGATVATFTDTNATLPSSAFTALINWGDGSTTTQGTVVRSGAAFAVQGSHTYLNPGTYSIGVTLYDESGHTGSTTTTGTVLAASPAGAASNFTGGLAVVPNNGPNAGGGFSNTNRPTFAGTAAPFAVVQLFAERIDIDAVLPLGQAAVSGAGQWTLSTGPLADGIYDVTAVVTPAGGYPGPAVPMTANNGQVVIDSTGPRVVSVTPFGSTGGVLVTLQAGYSGLNELSLLDPANYTFVGPHGIKIRPVAVAPFPAGSQAAGPQTVVLFSSYNPRLRRQIVALSITGSGITDMAGNPLQGGSYGLSAAARVAAHPAVVKSAHRARR